MIWSRVLTVAARCWFRPVIWLQLLGRESEFDDGSTIVVTELDLVGERIGEAMDDRAYHTANEAMRREVFHGDHRIIDLKHVTS